MNAAFLTRFLTGDLVAILIVAAILTWPLSWGVIKLYQRAVRRAMRLSALAVRPAEESATVATMAPGQLTAASPPAVGDATALLADLLARPFRAALVYLAAAAGYSVIIAVAMAWVSEPANPFRPLRLILLTINFAWPVVLAFGIVAGATRRQRVAFALVYAVLYGAVGAVLVWRSPESSIGQLLGLWASYNVPSTLMVWLCLARPIRAVGPLIMLVLALGFSGADLFIALVGSRDSFMQASIAASEAIGLSAVGTMLALAGVGFLVMFIVGGGLLLWIGKQYERKRSSDESITIQTLWWLFVFGHAVNLAFEHVAAPLIGVAAVVVFSVISRMGFAGFARGTGRAHTLLLLRSFSIGARSERFFDALQKHWRRVGSIEMIAGFDLAARTLEPHEFLDFITGKLSRRFIDSRAALEQRLSEMDTRPDRDGRFRVNEFFCHDDTWRETLLALVARADAVLMDLRGFTRQNAGCVFEIGELFRAVPMARLVFLVDNATDQAFLDETLARAAAAAHLPDGARPAVLTCQQLDTSTLRTVLAALARAVFSVAAGAPPAGIATAPTQRAAY